MLETSTTYNKLLADANHNFEHRIYFGKSIDMVSDPGYAMTNLLSLNITGSLFSDSTPSIGGCVSRELAVSMYKPDITLPTMCPISVYSRVTTGDLLCVGQKRLTMYAANGRGSGYSITGTFHNPIINISSTKLTGTQNWSLYRRVSTEVEDGVYTISQSNNCAAGTFISGHKYFYRWSRPNFGFKFTEYSIDELSQFGIFTAPNNVDTATSSVYIQFNATKLAAGTYKPVLNIFDITDAFGIDQEPDLESCKARYYTDSYDIYKYSEWLPQGQFFIDTRQFSKNDDGADILTISAYDGMLAFETKYPSDDSVTDTTQSADSMITKILNKVNSDLGLTSTDTAYITYSANSDTLNSNFTFPTIAGSYTCRECLSMIASANCGNFIINNSNELQFISLIKTPTVGESDAGYIDKNVTSLDISDALTDYYDGVIVSTGNTDDDSNEEAYEAGLTSGSVLEVSNEWANQTIADYIWSKLQSWTYQPYEASGVVFNPQLELGDAIYLNGVTSIIYNADVDYNRLVYADLSAPYDEEVNHEYSYESSTERKYTRQFENLESKISLKASEISLSINSVQEAANTAQSTADSAKTSADNANKTLSSLTLRADSIEASVSAAQTSADTAQSTADSAKTSADNAKDAADGAQSTADAKVDKTSSSSSFGWTLESTGWTLWTGSNKTTVLSANKNGISINGSGSFTGAVTATSGSFTGAVNATSGSFTGTINATSGTFTGNVKASTFTDGNGNAITASTASSVFGSGSYVTGGLSGGTYYTQATASSGTYASTYQDYYKVKNLAVSSTISNYGYITVGNGKSNFTASQLGNNYLALGLTSSSGSTSNAPIYLEGSTGTVYAKALVLNGTALSTSSSSVPSTINCTNVYASGTVRAETALSAWGGIYLTAGGTNKGTGYASVHGSASFTDSGAYLSAPSLCARTALYAGYSDSAWQTTIGTYISTTGTIYAGSTMYTADTLYAYKYGGHYYTEVGYNIETYGSNSYIWSKGYIGAAGALVGGSLKIGGYYYYPHWIRTYFYSSYYGSYYVGRGVILLRDTNSSGGTIYWGTG